MTARVIDLATERERHRDRATGQDMLVLAACCRWPVTLAWLFGIAAVEAAAWGRR